jgi:hypothetical protein
MHGQCPVCSKLNPADAGYCYYDGTALSGDRAQGPLRIGNIPFPTPFYFSDGQACANFNQLALACTNRWDEARRLLADGIWPLFFGGIWRHDLAMAARQLAAEPDLDRALSLLLEVLPADPESLRPATLAVESLEENLGEMTPGTDRTFEVVIFNQGMLPLRGMLTSTCDWLVFGDRAGPSQRMFETRNVCTVPVRVLGSKLRAGFQPLQGDIIVDSNGGSITVPVRVSVPIRPFPKGVYANDALADARSPRDIARKAKEFPNEAAILFEQSAVKAWYESNGWTYPIEGSEATGKGALQQFFEALGLTKPPPLQIDTASFMLQGKVGERLSRLVTLRTEEAKPVYAQAQSSQTWIQVGPIKFLGNKAKIPVEIVVPSCPGQMVHAQVTIQGNGKQRFVVPVSVVVEVEPPPVAEAGRPSTAQAPQGLPELVRQGIRAVWRSFRGQE